MIIILVLYNPSSTAAVKFTIRVAAIFFIMYTRQLDYNLTMIGAQMEV